MKTKAISLAATLLLPAISQGTILINEIVMRTPLTTNADVTAGTQDDENFEFLELRASTNTAEYCTTDGTINGAPLTVLIIKTDGSTKYGEVDEAWTLVDAEGVPLRMGTNGLLLLGDDYTKAGQGPYEFSKAPETTLGDPSGLKADNWQDEEGLTVLIVANYVAPAANSGLDVDFDLNDNGKFDWFDAPPPVGAVTAPYTAVVDSIGFNGDTSSGTIIRKTYAAMSLSTSSAISGISAGTPYTPYTIARHLSNTTPQSTGVGEGLAVVNPNSSSTAWYGGQTTGNTGDVSAYLTTARFNLGSSPTFNGQVTAGRPNLNAAPPTAAFRIGEINLEPRRSVGVEVSTVNGVPTLVANDGNYEYIEIVNAVTAANAAVDKSASLNGFTLVLIDPLGKIQEAWDLSKFATGSNGVLLLGDRYTEGFCPFAAALDPRTSLGDPSAPNYDAGTPEKFTSMAAGDVGPNRGFTMALVTGYNRAKDYDIDSNDDGTANSTTATTTLADALGTQGGTDAVIVDSLCVAELDALGAPVATRLGYAATAARAPGISIDNKRVNPSNYSRRADVSGANTYFLSTSTANSATYWYAGVLGARNASSLVYRTGAQANGSNITSPFRNMATPGQINRTTALTAPAVGSLMLNEAHINPGGLDDDTEFVEVISTTPFAPMHDTWLIAVNTTGANMGLVKAIVDLRNQNTGSNRLALFADGVEETGAAINAFVSAKTLTDDPQSFGATGIENTDSTLGFLRNILPNEGCALLLVTNPTTSGTTINADLDPENDGIINKVWTTTLDGVSTGAALTIANESNKVIPAVGGGTQPDNVSRTPGQLTPVTESNWVGGKLAANATATTYEFDTFFGAFKGAGSPGRLNPVAAPVTTASIVLNEVHLNPPGGDDNNEFIELKSTNDAVTGTNGWSILFVDNVGGDTGTIQAVFDLDGYATGSNGLMIAGNEYNVPAAFPWEAQAAAATSRVWLDGLKETDIGRFTDNGAACILLVKNFRGRLGDDLDIGTDANPSLADDHVFNTPTPWGNLTDSVSIRSYIAPVADDPATAKDETVVEAIEGFTFPGTAELGVVNLLSNPKVTWTPDTVARFRGINTPNEKTAWYGGDISGLTGSSLAYDAVERFPAVLVVAAVTPGSINGQAITDDSDFDADGVPFLIETALGMNPEVSDVQKLPQPGFGLLAGSASKQPYLSVVRPVGGVAGIVYGAEASVDLQDWTSVLLQAPVITANGNGTETLTYKINNFILPTVLSGGKVFFRFKASR